MQLPEELQEQFVNDLVKTKRLATAQNNLGFHLSDTKKRIKYLEEDDEQILQPNTIIKIQKLSHCS